MICCPSIANLSPDLIIRLSQPRGRIGIEPKISCLSQNRRYRVDRFGAARHFRFLPGRGGLPRLAARAREDVSPVVVIEARTADSIRTRRNFPHSF